MSNIIYRIVILIINKQLYQLSKYTCIKKTLFIISLIYEKYVN